MASQGTVYLELAKKTGGVVHQVCETNWQPIFMDIAKAVLQTLSPSCEQPISLPPQLARPSPHFGVDFVSQTGSSFTLKRVEGECPPQAQLSPNVFAYTIKDPKDPSKVNLCGDACDSLDEKGGKITYTFESPCGCPVPASICGRQFGFFTRVAPFKRQARCACPGTSCRWNG